MFTAAGRKQICLDYHARCAALESVKFDLEHEVKVKDYEVTRSITHLTELRQNCTIIARLAELQFFCSAEFSIAHNNTTLRCICIYISYAWTSGGDKKLYFLKYKNL